MSNAGCNCGFKDSKESKETHEKKVFSGAMRSALMYSDVDLGVKVIMGFGKPIESTPQGTFYLDKTTNTVWMHVCKWIQISAGEPIIQDTLEVKLVSIDAAKCTLTVNLRNTDETNPITITTIDFVKAGTNVGYQMCSTPITPIVIPATTELSGVTLCLPKDVCCRISGIAAGDTIYFRDLTNTTSPLVYPFVIPSFP